MSRTTPLALALTLSLGACKHVEPAPPPPPTAAVGGKRALVTTPAPPTVTATGCDDAAVASLPAKLRDAAAGALASAGLLVVDDEKAAHDLEVRVGIEVTYCNAAVKSAQGSASLTLVKDGALIHRSSDSGELANADSATSLMNDVVTNLVHDPAVVAAVGAAK